MVNKSIVQYPTQPNVYFHKNAYYILKAERLKRRQRDINVILTSLCERRFNISNVETTSMRLEISTLFQRRFNFELCLMMLKTYYQRCFNVGKVTLIQFAFSTFYQGRFNVVKVIPSIGSTLNQRHFAAG